MRVATFYTEQCTSPLLFHNFEVSRGSSNQSLKNYAFICDTISGFHLLGGELPIQEITAKIKS